MYNSVCTRIQFNQDLLYTMVLSKPGQQKNCLDWEIDFPYLVWLSEKRFFVSKNFPCLWRTIASLDKCWKPSWNPCLHIFSISRVWFECSIFLQYTNFLEVNDFYKVESMRGTYITSQMNSGKNAMNWIIKFSQTCITPSPSGNSQETT